MEKRRLGRSDLDVSALGFGVMTFGGHGRFARIGSTGVDEARNLLAHAFDAGVNLLDTADAYSDGRSEEVLGEALAGRRNDAIIATKAFMRTGKGPDDIGASRSHLVAACEASLRRLKTDRIDLYQLHHFDALTPLEETIAALDALVRAGKLRHVGASNYAGWQLMKALAVADAQAAARFCSHQIHYSLLSRDAETDLIPLGLAEGVGTLIWGPLSSGLLSGKIRPGVATPEGARAGWAKRGPVDQDILAAVLAAMDAIAAERGVPHAQIALNWLAAKPGVSSVLVGARDAAQLAENLGAAQWSLTGEEIAALDRASRPVRPYPHWVQAQYAGERNPYAAGLDRD